jgi:hypothetical protein
MANGPDWLALHCTALHCTAPHRYKLLWLRHVRENKGWSDEQLQKFIVRNYDLTLKMIILPESEEMLVRGRGEK